LEADCRNASEKLGLCASRHDSFPQVRGFCLFIAEGGQYNRVEEEDFVSDLIIAVGSARKPKLAAVREAVNGMIDLLPAGTSTEIVGVEVESGVSHTPLSREESMRGARQRAEALKKIAQEQEKPWNYFVGLEGGLDSVMENGERRVFLESWAYVSDGHDGHFGRSGAVEVPEALVDEVFVRGTDLSVAIDEFAGQAGIRDAQGAWGVLSANQITRQEAFRIALIAAFSPFFNEKIYNKAAVARQETYTR
jgi:inosine/xanthosine triphosphatase